MPPPGGLTELTALEGELAVSFRMGGQFGPTWDAWRASLEAASFVLDVLEEDEHRVAFHIDGPGSGRGYATLQQASSDSLMGALGWVRRPATVSFSSPCVVPPARSVMVRVRSRPVNPPPPGPEPPGPSGFLGPGSGVLFHFQSQRVLDLDVDGRLDAVVPIVEQTDCPYEVEYDLYVMRGSCGHLVGRTLGFPRITGSRSSGRLCDVETEREYSDLPNPPRSGVLVPVHHTVTTRYVASAGSYHEEGASDRTGDCHHCAITICAIEAP